MRTLSLEMISSKDTLLRCGLFQWMISGKDTLLREIYLLD